MSHTSAPHSRTASCGRNRATEIECSNRSSLHGNADEVLAGGWALVVEHPKALHDVGAALSTLQTCQLSIGHGLLPLAVVRYTLESSRHSSSRSQQHFSAAQDISAA